MLIQGKGIKVDPRHLEFSKKKNHKESPKKWNGISPKKSFPRKFIKKWNGTESQRTPKLLLELLVTIRFFRGPSVQWVRPLEISWTKVMSGKMLILRLHESSQLLKMSSFPKTPAFNSCCSLLLWNTPSKHVK